MSLVPDWLHALEKHRELGGEQDAANRQRVKHLLQQSAYRGRNKTKADPAPTEEEMDEAREARKRDPRRRAERSVQQGVAPRIAALEHLGAHGWMEDLAPVEEGPTPAPSDSHPLSCECSGCTARAPKYARLRQ